MLRAPSLPLSTHPLALPVPASLILLLSVGACASGIANGAAAGTTSHQAAPACAPMDSWAESQLAKLRAYATSTDAETVEWRTRVHIPGAADSAVAIVSSPTVCARALAAYNAQLGDTVVTSVYVIRVSNVFVASNPKLRMGEFVQSFVFDDRFRVLASFF